MSFALFLFLATVATGALWIADVAWAKKRRAADRPEPWWVEYGASFFPVILAVFLLRSFLVEPFKIPSGSMIPTLQVGDFILVNKYTYGIRLPVLNNKVIPINEPQRGDVVVFRYPPNPSVDYIKRIVGLPGDKVAYADKSLTVNGQPVPQTRKEDYLDPERKFFTPRFEEAVGDLRHEILVEADVPSAVMHPGDFPYREQCQYNAQGFECVVPAGHYFMMGDNRDNSQDSRYWGFVPDANLVGKAFFIWFNFGDFGRIGSFR